MPAAAASAPRDLSISERCADFSMRPCRRGLKAVLGIDELDDDDVRDRSDEPFHASTSRRRTVLLREVLATAMVAGDDALRCHAAVVHDLELRGQFPVGVFGEAARDNDLGVLARWRAALATALPQASGATRIGFGRAVRAPRRQLVAALELGLPRGRTSCGWSVRTELLVREPGRADRQIVARRYHRRRADKRSRYHLRGAFDHLVLAAAGIATAGHAHVLLPTEGRPLRVEHAALTQAEAGAYLSALASELLDHSHGYLLPFAALVRALFGETARWRDDDLLGFGPIARVDGLAPPADAAAIATRRLLPLTERMTGDHEFRVRSR